MGGTEEKSTGAGPAVVVVDGTAALFERGTDTGEPWWGRTERSTGGPVVVLVPADGTTAFEIGLVGEP